MNGKISWQTIIGQAWIESFPDSMATPAVEGNKVYTTSGFGDIACIDGITGKVIWTYKVQICHLHLIRPDGLLYCRHCFKKEPVFLRSAKNKM